jgi:dihydrofolate reductase
MITVTYYVACSLDGYIASSDGGIDWLSDFHVEGEDFGYGKFYESIDSMIMGSTTYEQVLGFGDWPYREKPCWVMSRRPLQAAPSEIIITDFSPPEVLAEIEARGFERAWLVGGGSLAGAFRAQSLIDEYLITILPTVLGDGIPIFVDDGPSERLHLVETHPIANGAVMLHYCRSEDG